MFIFAQFIGILASTLNIGKYFVREEKSSLIMILGTYFFIGVTLLLLNAYTGAICYMIIGTLVMCEYMYKIKNEKIPRNIYIIYGIIFLILIIFSYKRIYDLFMIIIILSNMILFLKNEDKKLCRIAEIINNVILTIYSALYGGYTLLVSTIICIGIYSRDFYYYDIKNETEPTDKLEIDFKKEKEKIEEEIKKNKEENSEDNILLTSKVLSGRNVPSNTKKKKILARTKNKRYSQSNFSGGNQKFTKK